MYVCSCSTPSFSSPANSAIPITSHIPTVCRLPTSPRVCHKPSHSEDIEAGSGCVTVCREDRRRWWWVARPASFPAGVDRVASIKQMADGTAVQASRPGSLTAVCWIRTPGPPSAPPAQRDVVERFTRESSAPYSMQCCFVIPHGSSAFCILLNRIRRQNFLHSVKRFMPFTGAQPGIY